MYIRYRAIDANHNKEILEMAEMVGISKHPKTHFVILTLAENYMDVYFKMSEEDYEKMIDEMCSNLMEGKNIYTVKSVGVMYDVNGYFKDSSTRVSKMNQIFEQIKFKN